MEVTDIMIRSAFPVINSWDFTEYYLKSFRLSTSKQAIH